MEKKETEEEISGFGGFSLFTNDTKIISDLPALDDNIEEDADNEIDNEIDNDTSKSKKPNTEKSKSKSKSKVELEESEEIDEDEDEDKDDVDTEVDNTEVDNTEEEEESSDEGTFKPFVEHLANKGIIDYDPESEFDDSEEGLETVILSTVNERVNKGITDYKQSIPEDGQKFLEFLENGGKPSDFHKYYYNEQSFEDFSLEDEEDQKYIYAEGLRLEGYSEEDITDEIQDAMDLGKLEKKAELHLKKLQKLEAKNKENLLEVQKKAAKEAQERQEQEINNFKKGLYESETIAGFKLSKKERDEIWDYMTAPIDKKTGQTQYMSDIPSKGAEARYLLAWMMKNNFDISKLEKKVQSKEVGKLRKKLGNFTDSRSKMKSGSSSKEEPNTGSIFDGFRKALE